MHFKSFIYKPNPQKAKEDTMSFVYLGGIILFLILLYIVFIRGMLAMAFLGSIAAGLIKLKIDDIKKKGVNRFGSLPFMFELNPQSVIIGSTEYKIETLSDLTLDADDFAGGPGGDIFSSSLGTDNFIAFTYQGEKHTYQFLVKKRNDLALIQQVWKEINKEKVM